MLTRLLAEVCARAARYPSGHVILGGMSLDALSPDEVLALRFDHESDAEELAEWCGGAVERVATQSGAVVTSVLVPTTKGPRPALLGNWIVRSADGSLRVMEAEDFAARHAPS